jgi:U4/U6 small nuclear ribonucleoprotein PRP31
VRLLAGKAALLARVACGRVRAGPRWQGGMLGEVQAKIEKWQEPPPAKQIKPLPKPDTEIKKHRRGLTCPPARLPLYRR